MPPFSYIKNYVYVFNSGKNKFVEEHLTFCLKNLGRGL